MKMCREKSFFYFIFVKLMLLRDNNTIKKYRVYVSGHVKFEWLPLRFLSVLRVKLL